MSAGKATGLVVSRRELMVYIIDLVLNMVYTCMIFGYKERYEHFIIHVVASYNSVHIRALTYSIYLQGMWD